GRSRKMRNRLFNVGQRHRARQRIRGRERTIGRSERLPAAGIGRDRRAALPRRRGAAFTARVRELDAGGASQRMDRAPESGETVLVIVAGGEEMLMADPSLR